jgi:DNA processing protein
MMEHSESIDLEMKALDLRRRDTHHKTSRSRQRGSSGEPYIIPENDLVQISTLDALIAGTRTITPEQQSRLQTDSRLWCAGDKSLLHNKCVAVVGTREVSPEGAARSRRLARELALAGVVVVSGLAKGVDTEALTSAIEAGGRVVAVVGTPIDRAYPAENKRLQEKIYREHLLISQFAPGERVFPSNFPERNKLMAALSDGTAITEAGDTSGTLHQAAECGRLGRWLFICRSVVEDASLQWPKRFLGQPKVHSFGSTKDILVAIGATTEEWH